MESIPIIISVLALIISFFGYRLSKKSIDRGTLVSLEQKKQSLRLQYHDIAFRVSELVRVLQENKSDEARRLADNLMRSFPGFLEVKELLESWAFESGPFKDNAPTEQKIILLKGDADIFSRVVERAWVAYESNDFKELEMEANRIYRQLYGSEGKKA